MERTINTQALHSIRRQPIHHVGTEFSYDQNKADLFDPLWLVVFRRTKRLLISIFK